MSKSGWKEFVKGFYEENPVLVSLLGLCPTLAVTTQTINGVTMGLATTVVLLGSNIIVSLLKNHIPSHIRIPSYIVVIASFVTLVRIFLEAFAPGINEALGIFIPLIVVNCMILGRAEAFASKNSVGKSILDALGMGLGFTLALTLVALIREILGAGLITLKVAGAGEVFDLEEVFRFLGIVNEKGEKAPFTIFLLPPGAFIVLGLIIGGMKYMRAKIKRGFKAVKKVKEEKQAAVSEE
jgi:electron transport complex protein RnfE